MRKPKKKAVRHRKLVPDDASDVMMVGKTQMGAMLDLYQSAPKCAYGPIYSACKRYVIDIDRKANRETKQLVRFLPLLFQCPNYVWDAAVEVIGNGHQIHAVSWLIHLDLNLHATLTPVEIAVHGDPELVMQRLGGIEYGVYS